MPSVENDSFYSSALFQAFFKLSGQSLILKADSPTFTILAVSDHYLELTHKKRSEVLNRGLFEVYPGNDAYPSEQYSVQNSFNKVIKSKAPDVIPTFKYEIYVPGLDRPDTQYWSNLNEPLLDAEGNVAYLINTTTNITGQISNHLELSQARKFKEAFSNEQEINEELLTFNESLALDNAQLGIEQKILKDLINKLTASEARAEQAELTLRQAVEAANVGTWYIHCANRELHLSARSKELFGYYPEETITFSELIMQVTEDHRERIQAAIEQAMVTVGPFDESYPVIGYHDQVIRWVRVIGHTSMQKGDFFAFIGVIMDISDLKANELLKNDFISMVSHELKSPLTALMGYGQLLSARAKKNEDAFALGTLEKMDTQVKKMTGMINGFLNKGHLESGKFHLQFSEFNLEGLVNELIDEVRLTAVTHIINIGQCDVVKIFADRDKIGNVISNLLSNAIKYSPQGKYIEVNCTIIENRVQLSVRDEGMGIMPKDIQKLFERYHRVKSEHTEKIAGFGIGLYLCAEIVRRHNGDIWAESEWGKGSTFHFCLPTA